MKDSRLKLTHVMRQCREKSHALIELWLVRVIFYRSEIIICMLIWISCVRRFSCDERGQNVLHWIKRVSHSRRRKGEYKINVYKDQRIFGLHRWDQCFVSVPGSIGCFITPSLTISKPIWRKGFPYFLPRSVLLKEVEGS